MLLLLCSILILGASAGCRSTAIRQPGEKLGSDPKKVWENFDCAHRPLPFVSIDLNQVRPKSIRAGEKFGHRLVYSMCPQNPAESISGELHRRIIYKEKMVADDVSRNFEVKPGQWRVDAIIQVPADAPAGVYSIEVEFTSRGLHFANDASIVVGKP